MGLLGKSENKLVTPGERGVKKDLGKISILKSHLYEPSLGKLRKMARKSRLNLAIGIPMVPFTGAVSVLKADTGFQGDEALAGGEEMEEDK